MADSNLIAEAMKRGYSLDEIADIEAKSAGFDPAEIRARGYGANEILTKLGHTLPKDDTGYIGDTIRGLKHGVEVTLPESTGKALKFFGADETGQKLVDYAKSNDSPDLQESATGKANDKWYSVRGNVYEAGDNAVLSMAPGAAGAAIGAGVGSVLPGVGTAIGALAGYAAGSIAALPIFYGSQAQESYEEVKKHQLAIGTPEAEADRIARLTAHGEGTIEAGGELVQDFIPFAKLFKPFGKAASKAVVSSVLKPTLTGAAKTVGETVAGEVATEMAQQAGEDWTRKAVGDTGEGATWDETAKVIMPTALMSVVPGGAGAGAHHYKRAVALNALSSPETDPDMRARIAVGAAAAMADGNQDVARAFSKYAADQIEKKAPIEINDDDQFYLQYRLQTAETGEEAIAAADAALAAPVEALEPGVDEWKGFNDKLYVAPTGEVMSEDQLPAYDKYQQSTVSERNAPLVADATQQAQDRLATAQTDEGTTDIEALRPKTILKRSAASFDTTELQALLANPETSAVTARAVHTELAARERAATPTVEGTGGTNELRTTMGGTAVTIPDAAPAKNNTVAEAVAILRTPAEQRVPADTMRLRNVAARIGPDAMAKIEQFVKGPALLTRDERVAIERLIASDARVAPAPAVTPATLPQSTTQQQLADNEAGRFSQARKSVFRNSQLRSETGPDIKGEKVTRNMRKALALVGRITGTKVIFEYAPEDSDGAVPNRTENTIHINTAAQINPMQVMGHEVTHVLKDRHAAAWAKVRDTLVATMPDKRKALDAFAADYWGGNEKNLEKLAAARTMPDWSAVLTPEQKTQFGTTENSIEDFLLDEMVSDLGGQHWSSEKFWTDVFAKIEAQEGEKARSIIERLVMSIKEMLGKFLEVVRAQKQGDYMTVSAEQIEATRDAITTAYAKLIRAERRTEPDGGPHDTHHRIGTSDTHSRSSGTESEPPAPTTERQAAPAPDTGDIDDLEAARAAELAALSPARSKRDQRLFFEVAPNPNDKAAVAAWKKRTDKQKRDVSNEVVSRIIPGLLADLHITGEVVTQLGGWMDDTNPSFALVVSRGDPLLAARAIGYVLDQEAVYALGLKSFTGAEKTGIIHIDIAGKDAHKIYMQIRALDRDAISGHSTIGNEMLIGLPIDRMNELEQDIDAIARKEDVLVSLDEGYGATIKDYGYDIRNETRDSRKQRAEAGYVDRWRAEARAATGPDATSRESDRAGALFSSNRPSYGTVRAGTGVSAVGVHYSQAERQTLSSRFFGTGMKGEERARIMHSNDERIKRRLYFYTNEGSGITPESGVGSHAHSVLLNNLYDIDVDHDNLIRHADPNKDWRDQPISPSLLMNYTEAAIIDAGYDGYVTHKFGKGGAVVLLGDHSVPVRYEGLGTKPDVPVAAHAKPSNYHSQRARVAANKSMPSGQMAGRDWKNLVPALMKGIDVSHLDDDTMYYKSELVQKPEAVRRSESRPPSWYYSPLARAADSAQMKTAPASGWKDWLKSLPAKGVKPDEIKWSGIEEWLDAQGKMPVTREQVQSFLSEFGVKVETILRGERNPIKREDVSQTIDEEDIEPEVSFGNFETDEPDEYYLQERAGERFDEEVDRRVDDTWDDIADDIRREARTQIEVSLPDLSADIRRAMGDMFPVDEQQVEQAARVYAAAQVAGDTWQEYVDEKEDTDNEDVQRDAVDRAFAVLSGDMEALEEEARRRTREEINDNELMDELVEQERQWHYDDSDSPATRTITVTVGDDEYEFVHNQSYGENYVSYNGREVRLSSNNHHTDDADIQGDILQFLMDEEGVSFSQATERDGDAYIPTKWEGYATDKSRAVSGSYREVQLTLPPGAHGQPRSSVLKRDSYSVFDADGNAVLGTVSEESAKREAERIGGRWEHRPDEVRTEREHVNDFSYTAHWQEKNVIGHARFDEHIDADGKRVMVLQEIQGDWGQQRREGLEAQEKAEPLMRQIDAAREERITAISELKQVLPEADSGWTSSDWGNIDSLGSRALSNDVSSDAKVAADKISSITTNIRELQREYDALYRDNIPASAPFIEKTVQWAGLVMKRMIAHAVKYGFDKVVWTNGAQQVERWASGLRQKVDTIAWEKTPEGIHIVASQRGNERANTKYAESALSDAIGKTMAQRIIADPNQSGEIKGDDITISDTGMAGFYDKMLPNIANEILKKLDKTVRVKDIEVHPSVEYDVQDLSKRGGAGFTIVDKNGTFTTSKTFDTREEAERAVEKAASKDAATDITTQQGFEITDKIRESAAAGIPLFSERRRASAERKADNRRAWYYSQLSAAVNDIPAKIKTGKEAAMWLQANAGKLGIKKDELQWSGVLDYLQSQPTPAGVSDWLRDNGVKVKDEVLGEESPEYKRLDAELDGMEDEINRLRKAAAGSTPEDMPPISAIRSAADGDQMSKKVLQVSGFTGNRLSAMLAYGRALNRKNELFEQRKAAMGERTKYEAHTLPGGTNYRELLLTLPVKSEDDFYRPRVVERGPGSFDVLAKDDSVIDSFRTWSQAMDESYRIWQDAQIEHNRTHPSFTSGHFNEPNVLAHLRFNERTDADGKRVLFIEEVQSDWAQKGRKDGFNVPVTGYQVFVDGVAAGAPYESIGDAEDHATRALKHNTPDKVEIREVQALQNAQVAGNKGLTPVAPFVTDTKAWVALALKRMIAHAVDNGFDRVAWTTGEQQSARYDLSKQVSYVRAIRNSDDTYFVMAVQSRESGNGTGDILFDKDKLTAAELEDTIGKDLAAKIVKQEKRKEHEYTGLDLKVGGEGMVAFYDGIVKPVARSLGATMRQVRVSTGADVGTQKWTVRFADGSTHNSSWTEKSIAEQIARKEDGDTVVPAGQTGSAQPGFDITDEMRQQARIGMPLFSTQRRPSPALEAWAGDTVVRNSDGSLKVMYHGTARDISTFRPKQADAIFLTDDPKFAGDFSDLSRGWMLRNYWTWMTPEQIAEAKRKARESLPPTGREREREMLRIDQSEGHSPYLTKQIELLMPSESNIMPLYVRAENPFDYRNPAHVAAIEAELGPSWSGHEFINGEMFEVAQHIGDLERGDWNAIESPQVQEYIRKNHDSFYVRERGVTNLAVFSPNQVKSASGNQGTYSREDNDIRRSETRKAAWEVTSEIVGVKRISRRASDGTVKIEVWDTGRTGKTMLGSNAVGRWKLRGYKVDGVFYRRLADIPKDNDIRKSESRVSNDEMKRINMAQRHGEGLSVVPEDMFKRDTNPGVDYSGVFQTAAEHIGDLIHRLSYREEQGGGVGYGIEAAINKASRFVKPSALDDVLDQLDRNYEYYRDERGYKGSKEDFKRDFRAAATRYAEAYQDMPYATLPQFLAKRAAVNLGRLDFPMVRANLRQLIDTLQGEQAEAHYWAPFVAGQTRESTPRSRITGQPINQTWTDPVITDWDDLVRKLQDDKIDTKRVLRAIRDAGVAVKEKFDAYMLETNYHGRAAARVDAFADGELRKLLEDMAMRNLSMQDLDDYLWARHAPERNAANNRSNPQITDGSGMSDAQAADIMAGNKVTINGRDIQLSAAALRSAAAVAGRVDAITNGTLDLLVSYGLETQQTVDTWRKTYGSYVPLKRDMESDANYSGAFGLGNGTGSGFSVRGAASKRAMGSKRTAIDILANVAMQRERAITRGEKNRVAQAVYGLALSAPNPEFWIPLNTELNKKLTPAALAKVIAELVSIGVNPIDAQNLATEPVQRYIDPKTGLEAHRINPALRGREDVLSARINGEDRYVMFSNKKRAQEMVRGLKNLDAAQVGGVLQVVAPVTRWFASINTQYNPVFGLTNGIRDFGTGMLNLSSTPLAGKRAEVASHAWKALVGVYADLRAHRAGRPATSQYAQLFEQFALDGGQTGYRDAFATSTDRAEAIAEELKHAGKGQSWLAVGEKRSHIFGWLSDYNTAVENAMRLSAYKVALDNGMSRDAAASLAKNLTVNFNKKGLAATQTGALYAFFNAAVQGTARIGETTVKDGKLTDAGKKIVYGGMMLGVLQAVMGAAAGWDDDEPPQFSREKNFIIPIPGSDKYVSIPMPLGFHVIPNIGRITAEWMLGGFKDPGKRMVRLAGVVLDAFNPIGSGTLAQTLSPTIGDPIIALSENKDWTGKSIYKEDFNKMHPTPGWTRTKDSASPPSRWMAYAINYITGGGKYEIGMASPTPDTLDYLVGQATGGTGRELLKTAQYINAKVTGEELPMHKTPLGVGRFIGETKGQSSEISHFYRNLERIGEHKSAIDEMKHDRNGAALQEYLTEHPEARLVQLADKASREIGYLRRQKRELLEKGASPERIKLIDEQITNKATRYNEMFKSR